MRGQASKRFTTRSRSDRVGAICIDRDAPRRAVCTCASSCRTVGAPPAPAPTAPQSSSVGDAAAGPAAAGLRGAGCAALQEVACEYASFWGLGRRGPLFSPRRG